MRSLVIFLVAAGFAFTWTVCGSEETPAAVTPKAPAVEKPLPPGASASAGELEVVEPDVMGFTYTPEGLRDPFEPFIKLETKKEARPQVFVPKTPLQRYATEELSLVGVIWGGKDRSRALIEDPEGKGYVVGTGTLVGDRGGKIVRIEPQEAVVEERAVDLLGEENVKLLRMTLRKPEDEVSP